WPGNGTDRVTGGSPRYRLYPTADGNIVAAAPLEQKFWEEFCDIIALDPPLRDDTRDPAATARAVAAAIRAKTAEEWRERFAGGGARRAQRGTFPVNRHARARCGHPCLHSLAAKEDADGRDKPGQDGDCYELSLLIGRRRGHDEKHQISQPGVGDRVLDPGRQE